MRRIIRLLAAGGRLAVLTSALAFATSAQAAYDVTIATSGASSGGAWVGDTWTPGAGGSTVLASEVESHLSHGPTIIGTAGDGPEQGDIHVNAAVNWSTNTLTLSAARHINVDAALTGAGDAALALEYGQGALAAGNTALYRINTPVKLRSNPSDPAHIANFTTKRGSDGSVIGRAVPLCPVILRDGSTKYGCAFLQNADMSALDIQYSTVETNGSVDSDIWIYVDLRTLGFVDPYYPYIMSCQAGAGQLYYPNSIDQTLYFDGTGAVTDLAGLESQTTTARTCKTWDNGPTFTLFWSNLFPNGYYFKFRPDPGESGNAYQIASVLVAPLADTNTGYSVVDYIVNVLPPMPAISDAADLNLVVSQTGRESLSLTGTGSLTVAATSSNTTLLPNANIAGAAACSAAGACTLTITPVAHQAGTATVTISVDDAYGQHTTASFGVIVTAAEVTYDGNGNTAGTPPVDGAAYSAADAVTVLGSGDLARTGYTFGGWNRQRDGRGTHYVAGDAFAIDSNVTLYAEWQPESTTVSLGGGAFSFPWLGLLLLMIGGRCVRWTRIT